MILSLATTSSLQLIYCTIVSLSSSQLPQIHRTRQIHCNCIVLNLSQGEILTDSGENWTMPGSNCDYSDAVSDVLQQENHVKQTKVDMV